MKIVKKLLVLILVLTVLWIDLPKNTTIFGRTINPLFNLELKLGLDLKGGSHLAFEADTSKISQEDLDESLEATRDVIERRVNFFGVSEPSVQTVKSGSNYKIVVDLPGITNVQDAIDRIGQTAQLTFREQDLDLDIQQATSEPALISFKAEPVLTGRDIRKAEVTFDQTSGGPQVLLNFSQEGAKKFAEATKNNIGKPIGIFLDDFILST
ncbi:MAG: hypothetical protein WEC80_00790, partial [Patescibacteria group bacterium]